MRYYDQVRQSFFPHILLLNIKAGDAVERRLEVVKDMITPFMGDEAPDQEAAFEEVVTEAKKAIKHVNKLMVTPWARAAALSDPLHVLRYLEEMRVRGGLLLDDQWTELEVKCPRSLDSDLLWRTLVHFGTRLFFYLNYGSVALDRDFSPL